MKYFDLFLRSLFQSEHLESCLFSFHFLFHLSGLRSFPLPFLSLRFLPYQCLIPCFFHRRLFFCFFFFSFFVFSLFSASFFFSLLFFFFFFVSSFFSFFFFSFSLFFLVSFILTAISILSSATDTPSGGSNFASIVPDSFIFDKSIS